MLGIPSLGPSGADAGLTQSLRSNLDYLAFGWDPGVKKVFLSVSYFLHDFSLTMPRKLDIPTSLRKTREVNDTRALKVGWD